jgi:hypothetical protein
MLHSNDVIIEYHKIIVVNSVDKMIVNMLADTVIFYHIEHMTVLGCGQNDSRNCYHLVQNDSAK